MLSARCGLHAFDGFDAQRIQTGFQRFRGQQRQLQAALTRFFAVGVQDLAVLLETGEQAGQIVQVAAHDVRRAFTRDGGEHLFELQQAGS